MKKIVAVFLILTMLTVFVSCGDNGDEQSDPTLNTNMGSPDIESTTAADTAVSGYVLTTDPNQTAPGGFTTDYVPTAYNPSDPSSGIVIPSLTDENSTTPIPSMSQVTIPSTQPTSNNGNNGSSDNQTGPTVVDAPDNTTKPSDPQEQDSTTEGGNDESSPKPKSVSSSSVSKLSNGDITIDISASGWDSAIVANKGTATVTYGSNTESASCSVSATVEGGNYVITVYTSKLEIYSGATVKVTIPEGLIKTASGTQYNRAFTSKALTF
ncbi:MAG: hypothetical protein IKJ27_04855 [Clostridia bacterium]|nr:hypothetical protein [Clostridia bacterium]